MHIALVSQEYPPETARGGIGTQTYLKAQGMAARGHRVTVVSQSTDELEHRLWDGPARVLRVPMLEGGSLIETEIGQWLSRSAQVAAALLRLQASDPLDIVDFPEWGCEGYVYLLSRSERDYVPTVVQLHGPLVMFAHTMGWPDVDSDFFRVGTHMEATCLRLADAVYSSSDCSANWCATRYELPLSSTPRIHTGVDTQMFRPGIAPQSGRPTVVYAGKIARNKGVTVLFDAVCRLAADFPDVRLVMLGRGEREVIHELKVAAATRSLEHVLEMPGFVDRELLPAHLCQAYVFAAPSIYEGGPGFVYLEAMACGLPVVACQGSGASEVVDPGETGYLVPPSDVDSLTDILGTLLSDRTRRLAMGERARQYAVREADSRRCLDRLESFYQRTVKRLPVGGLTTGGMPSNPLARA